MLTLKCKKHPRYKAALPPRASCEACIDIYSIASKYPRLIARKEKIERVPSNAAMQERVRELEERTGEGFVDGLHGPIPLDY